MSSLLPRVRARRGGASATAMTTTLLPLLAVLLLLLLCVWQPHGVAVSAAQHAGGGATVASRVVTLTSANFDEYVGQPDGYVFVLYCVKWASECRQLEALWADLSLSQAERQNRDVFVAARVDGDASPELVRRMNITGFPTMMYYTPLEPQGLEYNGVRELVLLDSFVFQFT